MIALGIAMPSSRVLFASLLVLAACGDDDTPLVDASVDAPLETRDAGADAALPSLRAPEAPRWTCPPGWSSTRSGSVDTCTLPPVAVCPIGQAHFVGGEGCEDVGRPCPDGDFALDLPAGALHVRPGADGDGSLASPFGSLADALAVASSGDVIALSTGEHEAFVQVPNGVTIRGACSARTHVVTAAAADFALGIGGGRSAIVEDLRVSSSGVGVGVAGDLTLRGVVIEGAVGAGLLVTETARALVEDVVVRDVTPDGTSGGMAVFVSGGRLDGTRVVFEDSVRSALRVDGGAVTLEDVRARAEPFGGLSRGAGALVVGGEVTLRRVDLRGATNQAVEVSQTGRVRLEDALVDELVEVDPPGLLALYAHTGGALEIERAFVRGPGWLVHVDDGTLAITDATLEGRGVGTLYADHAGIVSFESPFIVERVAISGTDSGLLTLGPFDFSIDPEAPPPPPAPPIDFTVSDLRLEDVGANVRFGYGVSIDAPFRGSLARVSAERVKGIALDVSSEVAIVDARVTDPRAGGGVDGEPSFAHALVVRDGDVSVERGAFEDAYEVAIDTRGGTLVLRDVSIVRARRRPCATGTCADAPGGIGLGVYFEAQVTADDLHVDGADLCGVQLAFDGSLDLRGGSIRGATVGACIQVDGYDVRRVASGVTFEDNGTNVETTSHAIPEPPPPPAL